jgi:hypothetical protein
MHLNCRDFACERVRHHSQFLTERLITDCETKNLSIHIAPE